MVGKKDKHVKDATNVRNDVTSCTGFNKQGGSEKDRSSPGPPGEGQMPRKVGRAESK